MLPRQIIKEIAEYAPGKNPEKPGDIKLASNENPFGPSPKALQAILKETKKLMVYPDQKSNLLRNAISKKLKIHPQSIIAGNGSDDLMQILASAFLSPADEVVVPENSFSVYTLVSKIFGGKIILAPLKDYKIDLEAILSAISEKTKIIFLTNPHNPCGTIFTSPEFDAFIKKVPGNILIVADEAYCEFSGSKDFPDTVKYIRKGQKNIIVLRTFSKFYGLAGLRAGYGVADSEIVSAMMKVKMPFNVNRLAQVGAAAALNDAAFTKKTYKNNLSGKKYLYKEFDKLGLAYKKTESNFIFIDLKQNADVFFKNLLNLGIIIRSLASFGFPQAIRVSIGTPKQNKKLIRSMGRVLWHC